MSEQQQIVSDEMEEIPVSEERFDAADEDMAIAEESPPENEPAAAEERRIQDIGPAPQRIGLWNILTENGIKASAVCL